MRTTTTSIRTVTRTSGSRSGGGYSSGFGSGSRPGVTTQIISGQSGLRHSLRGSGSGKVWKKTVPGKKFEFAEKLKEKKNYIMYVSGMGHEKNVIEEFEKIPEKPKIVEERQVIDNYEYHESKDLKKKKDPRRLSITHHQRLSEPFERTVVKKYGQDTSKPTETRAYKTSTIKSSRFGGGTGGAIDVLSKYNSSTIKSSSSRYGSGTGGAVDVLSKYNSFTSKKDNNYTVAPSKLYETYKPSKITTSYTKTVTKKSKAPVRTKINQYTSRTISRTGKPTLTTSKYLSTSTTSKYIPKYEAKSLYYETEPNKSYGLGDTQTKTETTQDGDYLIKITTSKKKLGGDYGSSKYISSRTESAPRVRPTYLESISSITKTRESPSYGLESNEITTELGTTESKVEERTRFLENDKVEEKEEIATNEKLERPETYDVESESRLGYGGPRPRPTFETRTKYESKVQKSEFGSRYGLGPRPTLGTRTGYGTHVHKTKGVVRHKPGCPLFEGNLNEERYRSESQSQGGRFGSNTFSGIRREISEVKKYSSTGRYGSRPRIGGSSYSSYNIGSSSLKKKKKSSKTSGSSKYSVLKTTTTTTSGKRSGRNYNYFESKDIKKKKKKKQPTTKFS
jgi:hypothetical protein